MHLIYNLTIAIAATIAPFPPIFNNPDFIFDIMSTSNNNNGWHQGELAAHSLLRVPTSSRHNPTTHGLPPHYAARVAASPILALGALDDQGRPWTTLWGGEAGFARPVARGVLGIQSLVSVASGCDPVFEALLQRTDGGAEGGDVVVRPEGGRVMSGLAIDLETRDRMKLAGRMVVGAVAAAGHGGGQGEGVREVQVAMLVEESLGNCPKYLNKKVVRPHLPEPALVPAPGPGTAPTPGPGAGKAAVVGAPLGEEALRVVRGADMFFLSSTEGGRSMDTNHRGGPRGFIRVLKNDEGGVVIVYPEYSGNRLYQTLGNLQTDPRVGVVIPDFDTSDVLYLTGETELLVGEKAARLMPHTKLAVKITVKEARFVRDGLPFRAEPGEPSPYNPPVRPLAAEGAGVGVGVGEGEGGSLVKAALVKREVLTPSVARLTFRLQRERGKELERWRAGQHVTLDFSDELDHGYSHMRDDDPQSLNDDYVRTFTVSNPPPSELVDGTELQITVRRHGPATGLLWRQVIQSTYAPLELPVLGFGGEEAFSLSARGEKKAVFVAGGVGITPLLAQASGVLTTPGHHLSLLWSLRAEDLGLAVDTFQRIPGLAEVTQLFVTGSGKKSEEAELVEKTQGMGSQVVLRRLSQADLLGARDAGKGTKYYVCTSPEMLKAVQSWIGNEDVVTESFNY